MGIESLMTVKNAAVAGLVALALKRQPMPYLDMGPSVADDNVRDVLQVLKGTRNAMYYAARLRFVHTLVMMLLFSKSDVATSVQRILDATLQHVRSLSTHLFIFKAVMLVLRRISGTRRAWHSAVAGMAGGHAVWSNSEPIVLQINLYLMSRVLLGSTKLAGGALGLGQTPEEQKQYYWMFGTAVWSAVMYLFYNHPLSLQSSLSKSMREIYTDADSIGLGAILP